jgi:hypothetical protein
MSMVGCTLTRNTALGNDGFAVIFGGVVATGNGLGGGIYNLGDLRMTNTTLFANQAVGGSQAPGSLSIAAGLARGGGLFQAGGSVALVHVTLSSNSASGGIGLPNTNTALALAGDIFSTNGTVTLWNSIVANSPSGSNCFGTLIDGGHNISWDGSCNFSALGSLNNTDPKLSDLGDFGGPTPTLALLEGSPALDAADAAFCPATDQRGFPRPYGPVCDIGAFEWQPIFSIRGTIAGWGVSGLRVSAGTASTFADAAGEYSLNGLLAGPYTVRPSGENCVVLPSTHAVTLGPDATNVNFLSYHSNAFMLEKVSSAVSRFVFAGAPQQTYQLLGSSNCTGWETVSIPVIDTNGFFYFDVTNGVSTGARFFETLKP